MARPSNILDGLSPDHLLLLAAQYASESNIASFRALAASRQDIFTNVVLYGILLNFLPETFEPDRYVDLLESISHGELSELDDATNLDVSSVKDLSAGKARSRAKKLGLNQFNDQNHSFDQFLIKRAHQIEEQTGLLSLIPPLVKPFLDRYPPLQTWYISCVLPLLRYEYEYYPREERRYSLEQVELADDTQGPDLWLSESLPEGRASEATSTAAIDGHLARDLRCLMGPWIHGESARKRRRLNHNRSRSRPKNTIEESLAQDTLARDADQGRTSEDVQHSWQPTFERIIQTARSKLPLIASAIEEWDGPEDVDLGISLVTAKKLPQSQPQLQTKYVQTALAAIYAAESAEYETISAAWKIVQKLGRIVAADSDLPILENELANLPSLVSNIDSKLSDLPSMVLEHSSLLQQNNPLTVSGEQSFALARFHVLSAGLLAQFGHSVSVVGVVKIKVHLDQDEQSALFQKITHNLASGRTRSDTEWVEIRQKLLWLWGWGNKSQESGDGDGDGVLGKIERKLLEKIILETLVHAGCYKLVVDGYVKDTSNAILTPEDIEQVIASTALQFYDSASNGNRTRGAMKKASDM
jgi:hypothetical protein